MSETISLETIIATDAETLYNAWLNSEEHSAMTGSEALCSDRVSSPFTAWDDYISGYNHELKPNSYIAQFWRTTEFKASDEDSFLEVYFTAVEGGTKILINHSDIPNGTSEAYKKGWIEYYFEPMKAYFEQK